MDWALETVVPPAEPVVSLEDAKVHLRVVHDDEDVLIANLVEAATQYAEEFQARSYVTRTLRLTLTTAPAGNIIRLPRLPIQSVVAVRHVAADNATTNIPTGDYVVTGGDIGHVELRPTRWSSGGVQVDYVAGYGGADDVPQAQRAAILMLVGHLFENRESITVGTGPTFELPNGLKMLLSLNRLISAAPGGVT